MSSICMCLCLWRPLELPLEMREHPSGRLLQDVSWASKSTGGSFILEGVLRNSFTTPRIRPRSLASDPVPRFLLSFSIRTRQTQGRRVAAINSTHSFNVDVKGWALSLWQFLVDLDLPSVRNGGLAKVSKHFHILGPLRSKSLLTASP